MANGGGRKKERKNERKNRSQTPDGAIDLQSRGEPGSINRTSNTSQLDSNRDEAVESPAVRAESGSARRRGRAYGPFSPAAGVGEDPSRGRRRNWGRGGDWVELLLSLSLPSSIAAVAAHVYTRSHTSPPLPGPAAKDPLPKRVGLVNSFFLCFCTAAW